MHLFRVVSSRSGPVSLRPLPLAGGRLPARIAELQRLSPLLKAHCSHDADGWPKTEKLPAAAIEKLNAQQLLLAQSQLLMVSRLGAVLNGRRPSSLLAGPGVSSVVQGSIKRAGVMVDKKVGQMGDYSPTESLTAEVDAQKQASLDCDILLTRAQQDADQAEQDRVAVESDIQQAYNLFKMAQAATDPKQKFALATQGLAVLKPVAQLIQDAEQAAADAAAASAQVKAGIRGTSCGVTAVDSAQQAADAASVTAQALNDPAYLTVIGLLRGALQNVRDAALPQVAYAPPPPPPECFQAHGPTWYLGFDVVFNEECTQKLIDYLDHNADIAGLAGALTGAIVGIASPVAGIIVGAVMAAIALDMKLAEQDTTLADKNHTGVTWHFSPIPIQYGAAFELTTLLTELADPGFGGEFMSMLWITGNS
jgi:hypothetical protein